MAVLGFQSLPELIMFLTSIIVGITMVMGVNAVNSAPNFMLNYHLYIRKDTDSLEEGANPPPAFPNFWNNILNFYTVVTLVAQTVHEPTNLTSFMCRFSLLFRLEVSIILMLIELLVILLMPQTGASEGAAIAGLVIVAYLGGAARAYFENTGFALFAPCPSKMLSGMLVGSAVSGALVSVIQIALMGVMSDDYDSGLQQSVMYFSLSMAIILLAAVLLASLLFNPEAKRYVSEFRSHRSPWANIYRPLNTKTIQQHKDDEEDGDSESGPVVPPHPANDDDDVLFDDREAVAAEHVASVHGTKTEPVVEGEEKELTEEHQLTTSEILQDVKLWPVITVIYPMMFSNFFTFFVTYLMYPGILIAVDPENGWYTTLIMATYNFGDLIGRVASMHHALWAPRRFIVAAAISRVLLIPLLVLCATGHIPGQAPAFVLTVILSISNGYCGTLSMVYAPDTEGLSEGQRAMAGQATGVCLLLGCSLGALVQLAEVIPFNK